MFIIKFCFSLNQQRRKTCRKIRATLQKSAIDGWWLWWFILISVETTGKMQTHSKYFLPKVSCDVKLGKTQKFCYTWKSKSWKPLTLKTKKISEFACAAMKTLCKSALFFVVSFASRVMFCYRIQTASTSTKKKVAMTLERK